MPGFRTLCVLGAIATWTLGCAPARCPVAGGPAWRELATPHFRVETDLDETAARALCNGFEEDYAALAASAFRGVDVTRPFDIVLLHDEDEFHDYVSPIFAGEYLAQSPLDLERSPTIVMFAGGDTAAQAAARVTFLHELTHRFIARAYLPVPTWLNEGLAEYYSSMSVVAGRVTFGDMPLTMQLVQPDRPIPVAELLHTDAAHFYLRRETGEEGRETRTSHYASAWAMVHFLKNGPNEYARRFTAFLRLLRERQTADAAWQLAFGGVDDAGFEDAFRRYVERPTWSTSSRPLARGAPPEPPSLRPLDDAEVHVIRARLLSCTHPPARVGEELAMLRAHSSDPAETEYWSGALELRRGHPDLAHEAFANGLRVAPDDARLTFADVVAHRSLLRGKSVADEKALNARLTLLLEALSRTARRPDELATAAEYLARSKRVAQAEPMVDRAVQADPDSVPAHVARAFVSYEAGRLDDAVLEQTRAIELAGSAFRPLVKTLEAYRSARVAAPQPAPTAPP